MVGDRFQGSRDGRLRSTVAGCSEHGNEFPGSIKGCGIRDWLSDRKLLNTMNYA
jgi:hypothetical protein